MKYISMLTVNEHRNTTVYDLIDVQFITILMLKHYFLLNEKHFLWHRVLPFYVRHLLNYSENFKLHILVRIFFFFCYGFQSMFLFTQKNDLFY